jgi:Domain of unknown function (DUF4430)
MKIVKILLAFLLTMFIAATPAYSQYTGTIALQEKPSIQCGNVKDKVSLTVQNPRGAPLKLSAPWTENATVILAMHNLEYQRLLRFRTKFSCPFGNLVTQINEVSPEKGQYWALFINNNLSNFGIDSATLKKDDSILWKLCSESGTCSL